MLKKRKKVVPSEYSGCFRRLTNDPAIIKMQTDAFGLLIHHKDLLHSEGAEGTSQVLNAPKTLPLTSSTGENDASSLLLMVDRVG